MDEKATDREIYEVEILRDAGTGVAISERWSKDGKAHRVDGPALIVRDPATGITVKEDWYINNEVHREDGPAIILRKRDSGRIYFSEWYRNGVKIQPARRSTLSSRRTPPHTLSI